MTITLAAVYAPVGIQGGLTGALFREFAFTLAGAVIVSGVVALTLSPMMGSRLLRAGDTERGFQGWINRRFDRVRSGYGAHARTHAALPAGRADAVGDRRPAVGAVLHVLAARAGAGRGPGRRVRHRAGARPTPRSTRPSCSRPRWHDVYWSFPETAHTFQITFPNGGFCGMVTKPWSERKKTTDQLLLEAMGPLSQIPGIRVIPMTPRRCPAAATSGGLRDRVHRGAAAARRDREPAGQEGVPERPLHVRGRGPEVRPAAGGGRVRPRQGALAGRRPERGRAATCR